MPRKKSGDRTLTPEEEKEWQQAMQFTTPLKTKTRLVKQLKKPAKPALLKQPLRADIPLGFNKLPELELGSYAGVDKSTREKFRKGEYDIDGRLDLHGDTCEIARKRVENFIHSHYNRGSRVLLIITGKGTFRKNDSEPKIGVLRESLPKWLKEGGLRPFILAFDKATVQDGGSGAFYVLLKRRRN